MTWEELNMLNLKIKKLYEPPEIEHKDLCPLPANTTNEYKFGIDFLDGSLHSERFLKGEFKVMKREPRYAIFFDTDGHPIDDCVVKCHSVSERFDPFLGKSEFDIQGIGAKPSSIINGGFIRRAIFGAPSKCTLLWDPKIKKVIFNDPATIIMWADGSKTVVKCQDGDVFDPEKGLAMAMCKKILGNKSKFNNEFKKWLPKESEKND